MPLGIPLIVPVPLKVRVRPAIVAVTGALPPTSLTVKVTEPFPETALVDISVMKFSGAVGSGSGFGAGCGAGVGAGGLGLGAGTGGCGVGVGVGAGVVGLFSLFSLFAVSSGFFVSFAVISRSLVIELVVLLDMVCSCLVFGCVLSGVFILVCGFLVGSLFACGTCSTVSTCLCVVAGICVSAGSSVFTAKKDAVAKVAVARVM